MFAASASGFFGGLRSAVLLRESQTLDDRQCPWPPPRTAVNGLRRRKSPPFVPTWSNKHRCLVVKFAKLGLWGAYLW